MDYQTAHRQLINKTLAESRKWRDQQVRANREGACDEIKAFERSLVWRMRRRGIPLFAHNMVRTGKEQSELYMRGVSKARPGKSPHNYGYAVDIVHSEFAWEIDPKAWEIIGHVGFEVAASLGIEIVWGGEWKSPYDPAHWEIADWKSHAYGLPKAS